MKSELKKSRIIAISRPICAALFGEPPLGAFVIRNSLDCLHVANRSQNSVEPRK